MKRASKAKRHLDFNPTSLPDFERWIRRHFDTDEYLVVKFHIFSMGETNDAFVDDYSEAVKLFREFRNEHGSTRIYLDADVEGDTIYENCIRSWDYENESRYKRMFPLTNRA